MVCTSKTLQTELAKEKGAEVEESTARKFLLSQGYKWLPRGQKRKYSAQQMRERQAFAQSVLNLGAHRLREKLSFSMDGCADRATKGPYRPLEPTATLADTHVAPEVREVGAFPGRRAGWFFKATPD